MSELIIYQQNLFKLADNSSKVMLKVILNRLKPQAREIITEEHTGFRAGRSTTEQIFNIRILNQNQATKPSANDTQREIKVKEQKLGRVTRFKYHTAVVLHDGFKPEIFSRIAQAT